MTKDTINKRRKLRVNLLMNLYKFHFNNRGSVYEEEKNYFLKKPEEYLAYKYLLEKGYIKMTMVSNSRYTLGIIPKGIDYIEKIILSNK